MAQANPAALRETAERFAEADPEHAADYRANAEAFSKQLTQLDEDLTEGLQDCTSTDLVTGHSAFAYFADRYGFHQESVSGLTPGAEPSLGLFREEIGGETYVLATLNPPTAAAGTRIASPSGT